MELFVSDWTWFLQSEGGRLNGSHRLARMIVHHGFDIVAAEPRLIK